MLGQDRIWCVPPLEFQFALTRPLPQECAARMRTAGAFATAVLGLLLAACGSDTGAPGGSDGTPPASPDATVATAKGGAAASIADTFDRLVTAETVFPDAAQRGLYRVVPAEMHEGKRVYGFELEPQTGMKPERHFHVISVTIGPAEGALEAGPSTLAGPNGAFNEVAARTSDGRYDVSVSEGNLLPASVELPAFDLTRTARSIAERYGAQRADP